MATLDEYNITETAVFDAKFTPTLNGILCTDCGVELKDERPGHLVAIDPPQERVKCYGCGFTGHRISNT